MRNFSILSAAVVALLAGPVHSAEEWGIDFEKATRIDGKVVSLLCEVTGDCKPDCGAGKRQLGLLTGDGRLIPVVKNFEPFAGATSELIQFCNQQVTLDGLLIDDPQMPLFAVQFKKPLPDGKWSRANWFGKEWSKANGGQAQGQWFRKDPRVRKIIKERGVFGIPGLKPEE